MSDQIPDTESSSRAPLDDGHSTEGYPTSAQALATPLDQPESLAGDDAGDADEEWVSQTTHGIRLGMPVAALLAVVLVAAGFWGGAELQKNHSGTSSSLAGVTARFRSAAGAGATGATGASRFGGLSASTAAAAGTITVVDGDTLYVSSSTGSVVKVTLTKSTTITRNADAAAADLRPGDTVSVQGATGSSGVVTATSVSATAPGVSSGFGGFARFGSGAAGATGAAGTSSNTTTTPALFGGG